MIDDAPQKLTRRDVIRGAGAATIACLVTPATAAEAAIVIT